MRSSLRAAVVAVSLLLPCAAEAGLEVSILEPGIAFGPAGAHLTHSTFDDIFIDGIFQETPWLSSFDGEVDFVTGAVQSLTVDDSSPDRVRSKYVYDSGVFTLTANWTDQFGNPVQGQYVAPLLSLVIDIRCEQELADFDCGDASGEEGSLGHAFISIGPGLFDDNLAHILRLHKRGDAFEFDIALDGITDGPADDFRVAGSQNGNEEVDIPVAVPEPSILSLLLLAPVLSRRFRR